jgi:hypothetical protein
VATSKKLKDLEGQKEIIKMTNFTTLKNGVQKFMVEVENDFSQAQNILDLASVTENFDSEYAFNERVQFSGVGTYAIMVERKDDFERFMDKLEDEKNHRRSEFFQNRRDIQNLFYDDKITREEAIEQLETLEREYYNNAQDDCDCKKCSFEISFDEWKNGKMRNGAKVGKSLGKAKFSKELLDFYSQQIKTEKKVYITISGNVQFIAGMSNFAEEDSWDGYNGTSCQDTRHDMNYCIQLGGALHDNKLFIAMLHEDLEDLEDMQDKLLARSLMRYVIIDGVPCLVPSTYYGNNETKSLLHYGLKQLAEVEVYSRDVREGERELIQERVNGAFEYHNYDEIYVCETFEDYVDVTCPMCDGDETITRYTNNDTEVEVTCPCCSGGGTIEASYYVDIDEWIEVEVEEEILPYTDDYNHNGYTMSIRVNVNEVKRLRSSLEA